MNRRQFISYLPLPFLPVSVLANGDDDLCEVSYWVAEVGFTDGSGGEFPIKEVEDCTWDFLHDDPREVERVRYLYKTDEVGIPVEPCPCCCSDDGVSWYSCDEAGEPLLGDPASCEAEPVVSDETVPVDGELDDDVTQIVQLPSTGSGSSLPLEAPVGTLFLSRTSGCWERREDGWISVKDAV